MTVADLLTSLYRPVANAPPCACARVLHRWSRRCRCTNRATVAARSAKYMCQNGWRTPSIQRKRCWSFGHRRLPCLVASGCPGKIAPSRSCRGCLAFAPRWRLAVAWFQSFCCIHPMNHCELSTNSSASSRDCSTRWKPMLWAALELTRTCAPWLRQAVSAGTLRNCCNKCKSRAL